MSDVVTFRGVPYHDTRLQKDYDMQVDIEGADGTTLDDTNLDAVPREGEDVTYLGCPCRVLLVAWEYDEDDGWTATVRLNKPAAQLRMESPTATRSQRVKKNPGL